MRARREEAQATLQRQRPRPLSESLPSAALDAALAATARAVGGGEEGGGASPLASWATERRERLRIEASATEKVRRLSLFASDLDLLGLSVEGAAQLDEKTLRQAFRARSRELHPDVRAGRAVPTDATGADGRTEGGGTPMDDGDGESSPSVYELNAAYEAIRKLL